MKYIDKLADVKSDDIGENSKVWQFSVVLEGAKIGKNCNVNCHCFIENDVLIGDNVTIKSGVYLWDGIEIEDNVFIGPNVTFINDKTPRSKKYPEKFLKTKISRGASIGAGSIIMGGITIGANALIGAGSLLLSDVPNGELWFGSPAKFIRKI